jgi:ribonuclease G
LKGNTVQQEVLINWSPQETRVAVIEQGVVQEVLIERALERGLVGNVYLGKVTRVLPGMQSAFIDIGLERTGFLHVADLWPRAARDDPKHTPVPIERQLHEGQRLVVQVLKDPLGTKGARLTAQISVAGRLLVYLPKEKHIGVSQKIPFEQRESLRVRLQTLAGDDAGGFILRTNAEDASDDELAQDIGYLQKTWALITHGAQTLGPGQLLHADLSLLQRVLRDIAGEHTQRIRVDSREQMQLLQAFAQTYMPSVAERIELYKGERTVFDLHQVDAEIVKALQRRVDLKSGGYLVIDQTEALTAIDINTGGYVGARNFDETIFKTNLEAAGAIAHQLRLRNLGGIIVIDFIDMTKVEHQQAVLSELRKHLSRDRVKTHMGVFSSLGLLEMTRKRDRESLAQCLTETCEACTGRGVVKTPRTVCYDILREILTEARSFNPQEFRVIAHPRVIEMFLDEESAHLAGLSTFIGKPISLHADNVLSPEHYDIVLR